MQGHILVRGYTGTQAHPFPGPPGAILPSSPSPTCPLTSLTPHTLVPLLSGLTELVLDLCGRWGSGSPVTPPDPRDPLHLEVTSRQVWVGGTVPEGAARGRPCSPTHPFPLSLRSGGLTPFEVLGPFHHPGPPFQPQ